MSHHNVRCPKGYGDVAVATMYLYCSPLLAARINQALRATQDQIVTGRGAGGVGSCGVICVHKNIKKVGREPCAPVYYFVRVYAQRK